MKTILCKECGSLAHFNSHFGAYFCSKCNWFDNTYNKERIKENTCISSAGTL